MNHDNGYVKEYDLIESSTNYNLSKYVKEPRDCDVKLMEIVARVVGNNPNPAIVDLGCGSGHQLLMAKELFPNATLEGRDLAAGLIHKCRLDAQLGGINFAVQDITKEPANDDLNQFDVVIITAVLQVLPFDQISTALRNIAKYLRQGGWLINFDGYHNFDKIDKISVRIENVISECPPTSTMTYHYPSKKLMTTYCVDAGFVDVSYTDFAMSSELPYVSVSPPSTYTLNTVEFGRLSMLGIVAQPWSYLVARNG